MASDRTTLRLNDERKRLLDRAGDLLAADDADDPPMADVIDAALTHLLESEQNIEQARGEVSPEVIQEVANTSVLKLHYRTSVETPWRR